MKKFQKRTLSFASILFPMTLMAGQYALDTSHPTYSQNDSVDSGVKGARKALNLSVSSKSLDSSIKVKTILGKEVFSRDKKKLGRVHEALWNNENELIFIISSGGFIPKLDLGDKERAVYASKVHLSEEQDKLYADFTMSEFKKEPIVKNTYNPFK